jgi:c-di-GMP-binding flagellar brake protein YcgR
MKTVVETYYCDITKKETPQEHLEKFYYTDRVTREEHSVDLSATGIVILLNNSLSPKSVEELFDDAFFKFFEKQKGK